MPNTDDRLAEVWNEFVASHESLTRLYELVEETNQLNRRHMDQTHMWAVVNRCNNKFDLTFNGNTKMENVPLERALGYMEAICDHVTSELENEILGDL